MVAAGTADSGAATKPRRRFARSPVAFVSVVLALGAFLETRLWVVAKFPYFVDEGILAYFAQLGRNPDQRLVSLEEGVRPGLVWLTLVGMRLHLDPLWSIRLAALSFGLLGAVCGTLLAARHVGKVGAVAFAVLVLATPYLFVYEPLGLRDPVIAGLMLAGLLLEIELARNPRPLIGALLGVTFALDLLVKESGEVALYLLPLSLLYFPFRSPERVRLARTWVGSAALALLVAYLGSLPMKLSSNYGRLASIQRNMGVIRTFSGVSRHPLRYFDQSWPEVRGDLTSYLTYPILALVLVGLVLGLRYRTRFTALVAIWAIVQIGSVILLAGQKNLDARYLVPAIGFVLLIGAIGVEELAGRAGRFLGNGRRAGAVGIAAGLALLVPALIFDGRVSYDTASAPFPPGDKLQFVTGSPSGYGAQGAIDELAVLANGQHLDLLANPALDNETYELLGIIRGLDINWIWTDDPAAKTAALFTNGTPLPTGVGSFRQIWSYQRPDGGTPLAIYIHR